MPVSPVFDRASGTSDVTTAEVEHRMTVGGPSNFYATRRCSCGNEHCNKWIPLRSVWEHRTRENHRIEVLHTSRSMELHYRLLPPADAVRFGGDMFVSQLTRDYRLVREAVSARRR